MSLDFSSPPSFVQACNVLAAFWTFPSTGEICCLTSWRFSLVSDEQPLAAMTAIAQSVHIPSVTHGLSFRRSRVSNARFLEHVSPLALGEADSREVGDVSISRLLMSPSPKRLQMPQGAVGCRSVLRRGVFLGDLWHINAYGCVTTTLAFGRIGGDVCRSRQRVELFCVEWSMGVTLGLGSDRPVEIAGRLGGRGCTAPGRVQLRPEIQPIVACWKRRHATSCWKSWPADS